MPHIEVSEYTVTKKPGDFSVSTEMETDYFGNTHKVKKYRVEIEGFMVEGSLKLKSGIAPKLTITDLNSGIITHVKEHGTVRAKMRRPKANGEYTNITAVCSTP